MHRVHTADFVALRQQVVNTIFPPQARQQVRQILADIRFISNKTYQFQNSVGPSALAPGARAVLSSLAESGPKTVPQLAGSRSTSRQNIQVIVNRLVQDGLAKVETNPHHRRSLLVSVTEQGRQSLQSAPDLGERVQELVLQTLTEPEVARLAESLGRIRGLFMEKTRGGSEPQPILTKETLPQSATARTTPADSWEGRITSSSGARDDDNELPVNLL